MVPPGEKICARCENTQGYNDLVAREQEAKQAYWKAKEREVRQVKHSLNADGKVLHDAPVLDVDKAGPPPRAAGISPPAKSSKAKHGRVKPVPALPDEDREHNHKVWLANRLAQYRQGMGLDLEVRLKLESGVKSMTSYDFLALLNRTLPPKK